VHVKVHVGATLNKIGEAIYIKGGHVSHTGQLFFDDTVTDEVAKLVPYTLQKNRRVRNSEDGIYSQAKGSTTIIPLQYLTGNGLRGAVKGEITLGVDPNAVSISGGGPGGGPPRPPPGR
jgi:hypothetical protein